MQVFINNNDLFLNSLVVTDSNDNDATVWSGPIAAHEIITVNCLENDSGFGNIQTNADGMIVNRSFLHNGDTISL